MSRGWWVSPGPRTIDRNEPDESGGSRLLSRRPRAEARVKPPAGRSYTVGQPEGEHRLCVGWLGARKEVLLWSAQRAALPLVPLLGRDAG